MFKKALYAYLKSLVRFSFALFYTRTLVLGKEHLRLKGPTILATNHPNTLVDALNAAGRTDSVVHFLVNAGLYRKRWSRALFDFLYCIPIKRQQDPNDSGVRNSDSFTRIYDHLAGGGHLFVAPEGGSEQGRHLRPLKKGAARILLQTRAARPEAPVIRLQPIGFTYSDPETFGSQLIVHVGEPILDTDWADRYAQQPAQAIRELTQELSQRLTGLMIATRDGAEDRRLSIAESILQARQPLNQKMAYARSRQLLQQFRIWEKEEPTDFRSFSVALTDYQQFLDRYGLTSQAVGHHGDSVMRQYFRLFLGLPFYLFGYLNNFLAIGIPRFIATRRFVEREYRATVQILLALVTVPLLYLAQTLLVGAWLSLGPALIYFTALLPSGYFAWFYRQYWKSAQRAYRIKNLNPTLQLKLTGQYERLGQQLEKVLQHGVA